MSNIFPAALSLSWLYAFPCHK